jgi:hypothetical protein
MLDPSLFQALCALALRLDKQPVNWAITASCGLALQGIAVAVHDVDLATDRVGAYRIEQLFAREIIRPVRFSGTETIRSHYGAFSLVGFEFDIIGDAQYRRADGGWDEPEDFTPHKHYVQVEELTLPVLTLEYEYTAYLRLGRVAKVKLLGEWLGMG